MNFIKHSPHTMTNQLIKIINDIEKEFDEKYDTINTYLVLIETMDGFTEQRPATKEVKDLHTQSLLSLLQGMVEWADKNSHTDTHKSLNWGMESRVEVVHLSDLRSILTEAITNLKK